MSSLFGGSTATAPTPPKFTPVDIPTLADQATAQDELGFQMSDADLAARFPGLVAQRNADATDASNQITQPLDPTVENAFATNSLAGAFSAFGGGANGANIGGAGSAARGSIAAGITSQTQAKEDSDRTYLQQQLADNPERQFGASGQDEIQLAISNALGANNANYGAYVGGVSTANAQSAQSQQTQLALASIATTVAIAI
jgi:hypothetical protein